MHCNVDGLIDEATQVRINYWKFWHLHTCFPAAVVLLCRIDPVEHKSSELNLTIIIIIKAKADDHEDCSSSSSLDNSLRVL